MGVFYRSESLEPLVKENLTIAFTKDPKTITSIETTAAEEAKKIAERARGEFSWKRILFAIGLAALVFFAAVYTGKNNLEPLYLVCVHSFEIILGGVTGLLIGEVASNR